jgi:hypothetical protein
MYHETTQKVLERLGYERLLNLGGLRSKRRRITFEEAMLAAKEEPRILEVLPALLRFRPTILQGAKRELKRNPELNRLVQNLFETQKKEFSGIPIEDCRRAAISFQKYLQEKKNRQRHRLFNFRLNDQDWERLEALSRHIGTGNHSETLRRLIAEKFNKVDFNTGNIPA